MTIKDLVLNCNFDGVVQELAWLEDVGNEHYSKLYTVYYNIFKQVLGILPAESKNTIVGILLDKNDQNDGFDLAVYKDEDVLEHRGIISQLSSLQDVKSLSQEEIDQLCTLQLPLAYSVMMNSWAEILGYRVVEENVKDVGAEKLIAAILYEMTYFGYSSSEADIRRKDFSLSLNEAAESYDNENENTFSTLEDVFGPDMRTKEEKEAAYNSLRRNMLQNSTLKAKALKKYFFAKK